MTPLAGRRRNAATAAALVVAFASCALPAAALDCPDPPRQQQRDWDTQVRAEVGRIGPVRGAELQTRVRSATVDLLAKLPGADRLYLEQMMFASYCSALRADKSISEGEKARQVLDYRRELQKALQQSALQQKALQQKALRQ